MDAPLRLDRADPEFEPLPAPTLRLRDFDPRDHQRLVVNPFLAVFGLIALAWALRQRNHFLFEPVNLALLLTLFGLRFLIEYHCLDCGVNGRYVRWKHHACPRVVDRWISDKDSRFPTARTQLFVWGWLLGSVAVLLLVLGWE